MDWVAAALTLIGLWLVGSKNIYGFVVGMVSNMAWIGWGYGVGAWSVIAINAALFVLNIRAVYLWDTKKS